MSLYKRLIKKTLRENVIPFAGDRSRLSWRKKILREFGEWVPIGGGPTNGTSQTFGYFSNGEPVNHYETGAQITYTASGLGGQDAYPSTVTIDFGYGEVFDVATPTYAQLALAGLALPMSFVAKNAYEEARKKYEEELEKYKEEVKAYSKELEKSNKEFDAWYEKNKENQENVSNYLKSLGTSWEDLRKNNWSLQLGGPGGDIIGVSNDRPGGDGYEVTVVTQHPNAVGRIHFIQKTDKSWEAGFAVLKSQKTFSPPPRPVPPEAPSAPTPPDPNQYAVDRIQPSQSADEINQILDSSQEFAQNVGADYMMGARIADDGSVILPDGSIYIELGPGGWQQSIISSPEDPAFKAGGGFAKIEQGYTYDQVLELGRKNIAAQVAQIEKQKPNTTAGFDTLKQPVVFSAAESERLRRQNRPLTMNDFNSSAAYAAYKAGGGDAAVRSGKSVQDVINQGSANIGKYGSGTRKTTMSFSDFKSSANYSAYKAGGGDAAVKSGKTIQQVIDQGKSNIGGYDSGSRIPSKEYIPAGGGMGGKRGSGSSPSQTNQSVSISQAQQQFRNATSFLNPILDPLEKLLNNPTTQLVLPGGGATTSLKIGPQLTSSALRQIINLGGKGTGNFTAAKGTGAPRPPKITDTSKEIWNTKTGKYETVTNKDGLKWEWAQRTLNNTAYKHYVKTGEMPSGLKDWNIAKAFTPSMMQTGPTPMAGAAVKGASAVAAAAFGLDAGSAKAPESAPQNQGSTSGDLGLGTAALTGALVGGIKLNPSWNVQQATNAVKNVNDYDTLIKDTKVGLGKGYSFTDWQPSNEGQKGTLLKDGKPVMGPDGKPLYMTVPGTDKNGSFTSHGNSQRTAGNNYKNIVNYVKNTTPATETGRITVKTEKPGQAAKSKFTDFQSGAGPKPKTGTQTTFSSWSKSVGKALGKSVKFLKFSHEMKGELISESRQRILHVKVTSGTGSKTFQQFMNMTPGQKGLATGGLGAAVVGGSELLAPQAAEPKKNVRESTWDRIQKHR